MSISSIESKLENNSGSHALVIGGSIAGLLAARVLVNHFDRVTIVERDRFPEQPEPRQRVLQANHIHVVSLKSFCLYSDLTTNQYRISKPPSALSRAL